MNFTDPDKRYLMRSSREWRTDLRFPDIKWELIEVKAIAAKISLERNTVEHRLSESIEIGPVMIRKSSDKRTNESTLHISSNIKEHVITPLWNNQVVTGVSNFILSVLSCLDCKDFIRGEKFYFSVIKKAFLFFYVHCYWSGIYSEVFLLILNITIENDVSNAYVIH